MRDTESVVLVTGAAGFVAAHIVKQLQEQSFNVRGTLSDLKDESKVKLLKELCPDAEHALELVEADLSKAESWEQAVSGCSYVIHTSSPLPFKDIDTEERIKQSVDGTLALLKACQKEKVQRVILTSSIASIVGFGATVNGDKSYTEDDMVEFEKADPHSKVLIQVEKAAFDFAKELPEEEKFELVVINPAYIMGPVINGQYSHSMEVPKKLLERSMPAVPKIYFPIVDVRDVAAAHIKAISCDEAVGKRHILISSGLWLKEIAQIMQKEFKPHGYNIPTMHCPYVGVWLKGLFDKTMKATLPLIGKSTKIESSRMQEVLGIDPREAKDTIVEMCYSLIESGLVKKSKKYAGPDGHNKTEEKEEKVEANGKIANGDVAESAEKEDNEAKADNEAGNEDKVAEVKENKEAEEIKTEPPETETATEKTEETSIVEKTLVTESSEIVETVKTEKTVIVESSTEITSSEDKVQEIVTSTETSTEQVVTESATVSE